MFVNVDIARYVMFQMNQVKKVLIKNFLDFYK